ncbi:MAG: DUF4268 domain-containing protein [Bacteroidales bacterium]|nr:DUF4268 domain-containing protein [Bacteroidales bacterium]
MYSKEEAQEMRHAFWHKLESKTRRLPGQNGRPIKWINDRTGIKGLDLRFDVDTKMAMVAMEINPIQEEKLENLWEKMNNCKSLFEATFGGELVWDRNYVKNAGDTCARIYVRMDGNIYDKEKWPDMIHFLIDNMLRLEKAFLEVQDYLIHF